MTSWDSIRSKDAAEACCKDGRLAKALLLPKELGGQGIPENTVYIPASIMGKKEQSTRELMDIVRRNLANQVSVTPQYRGDSFVPARICISAWCDDKPKAYDLVIDVW